MTEMLHIVRKDVRRLRVGLVIWCALLATRLAVTTVMASAALDDLQHALAGQAQAMLHVLEWLVMALLVARLVHDEPAVGPNAFWLTRPYHHGPLVAAKLLDALTWFVLLPLLVDLVVVAAFGGTAGDLLRAGSAVVASELVWTVAFLAVAAVTPSLPFFAMILIGAAVALIMAGTAALSVLAFVADDSVSEAAPSFYGVDSTPTIVLAVLVIVVAVTVVWYQYRARRWRRAAAFGLTGIVASFVVSAYWPWPFARQAEPQPGAWASEARPVADTLSSNVTFAPSALQRSRARYISSQVRLTGKPAHIAIENIYTSGRLVLPDAVTIESRQAGHFSPRSTDPVRGVSSVAGALAVDVMSASNTSIAWEPWPALIALDEREYARHHGAIGRLTARLDFFLKGSRVIGALPLVEGASLHTSGRRFEILRVTFGDAGAEITLRRLEVDSLLGTNQGAIYSVLLRNRARREAVGHEGGTGSFSMGHSLSLGLGITANFSDAIAIGTQRLEFPERSENALRIDREWLADAELVVVETAYAGRVTKDLVIEEFRIP